MAKEDNPAILPSTALRNLENKSVGGDSKGGDSKGGGTVKKKSSTSDNSNADSSSFTHTVELVSQGKEDHELAHLAVQVSTSLEAIYTVQQIDADRYRPQTEELQRDLANTVLHQVHIMQLRTDQFNDQRVQDATADVVARQIVDRAKRKVSAHSTPLSSFGSRTIDPESTQMFRFDSSISNITSISTRDNSHTDKVHLELSYSTSEALDATMHGYYGYVTMADSSWIEKQPTTAVLLKLRTFLDLRSIDDEGLFIVQKWMKLLANKLNVDLGDYGLDNFPPTKRSRLSKDSEVDIVDDSYNVFA